MRRSEPSPTDRVVIGALCSQGHTRERLKQSLLPKLNSLDAPSSEGEGLDYPATLGIAVVVQQIVASELRWNLERVTPDTKLFAAAGNHLVLFDICLNCERYFPIKISNSDVAKLRTVGSLSSHIEDKLSHSHPSKK
jgi:acyl carrier protein